jgi:hypothetical protein
MKFVLLTADGFSFKEFFDFLGGQILLVGALPLFYLPVALAKWKEWTENPRYYVYWVFFCLPLLFFISKTLQGRVEANWVLPAYMTFWIMGERSFYYSSFKGLQKALLVLTFLPPTILSGVILVHLFHPLELFPVDQDRLTHSRDRNAMVSNAASFLKGQEPLPVFTHSYQWTSHFRFHKVKSYQLPTARKSHFTFTDPPACNYEKIFIWELEGEQNLPPPCFTRREPVKEFIYDVRGRRMAKYYLVRYGKT